MSDLFNFWTHGVNVVPEYTREYTNHDNGLYMRRAGWGTQIRQRGGTSNWFHFPVPSTTRLDNDSVALRQAWLYGNINDQARLKNINIWHFRVGHGLEFDNKKSLSAVMAKRD